MNVKKGDLIIGHEGAEVIGICQMTADAIESYRYDNGYEYAQTIGFPVTWIDWNQNFSKFSPKANARSLGIRGLNNESAKVIEAWKEYKSKKG